MNLSSYNDFNFYSTENNKNEENVKYEECQGTEQKAPLEKVRVEDLFLNI